MPAGKYGRENLHCVVHSGTDSRCAELDRESVVFAVTIAKDGQRTGGNDGGRKEGRNVSKWPPAVSGPSSDRMHMVLACAGSLYVLVHASKEPTGHRKASLWLEMYCTDTYTYMIHPSEARSAQSSTGAVYSLQSVVGYTTNYPRMSKRFCVRKLSCLES